MTTKYSYMSCFAFIQITFMNKKRRMTKREEYESVLMAQLKEENKLTRSRINKPYECIQILRYLIVCEIGCIYKLYS
jgi:hypothetical protein